MNKEEYINKYINKFGSDKDLDNMEMNIILHGFDDTLLDKDNTKHFFRSLFRSKNNYKDKGNEIKLIKIIKKESQNNIGRLSYILKFKGIIKPISLYNIIFINNSV
jgi:hypothetical protein